MNKKKLLFLIFFVLLLLPTVVLADTDQNISLKMAKCDLTKYGEPDPDEDFYDCVIDYQDGELDSYIVENNGNVEPGDTILGVFYYTPGTTKLTVGINAAVYYDRDSLSMLSLPSTPSEMFSYVDSSEYPKRSSWIGQANDSTLSSTGKIIINLADDTSFKPLTTEQNLLYFMFKVSESAIPGSNINLRFSDVPGEVDFSDATGEQSLAFTTTDFVLSVYGEQSRDASLSSITVKNNGTTYPLSPSLSTGIIDYDVAVPNNITSIDLDAVVNNEYAIISPLSLGTKSINVGDNVFSIVVTSQYGDVVTYTINVRRLSSESMLSSLSLNNGVVLEDFSGSQTEYNISVPYAKTTTSVSATVANSLSSITSGLGTFNFLNYGDTVNTREVLVKAENCKSEYASVPGNSCSSTTYTINVTRENPSSNKYLSELKALNSMVPSFNKESNSYDIGSVSNSTSSILISAVTEDPTAIITSGTGTININVGDNELPIVVTAEDGSTNTYTINVRRLSNNVKLKGLVVSSTPSGSFTPTFQSSFTGTYTYSYPSQTTSVSVKATAMDTGNASVAIVDVTGDIPAVSSTSTLNESTETFNVPSTNKVTVIVTAEDGTIGYQSINLNRQLSSDANLKTLSLSEGTLSPSFNSSTSLYSASVSPTTTSVIVNATTSSVYGNITSISGNTDLSFGTNTITILVEAEDGSDKSYIINVTRERYTNANLSDIKIDGVSIKDFDPEVTEYDLDGFTKNSVVISATSEDTTYGTVSGTGTESLAIGNNTVIIRAYAHNTSIYKDYTININRLSNNTKLGSLNITSTPNGTLSPSFQSSYNGEYSYAYPETANLVNVTATVSDTDKATISIHNGVTIIGENQTINTASQSFEVPATTTVTIVVTAEDGTIGTHTINLSRQLSSDADLKSLSLSEGTLSPDFNSSTPLYTASVAPTITNVIVNAEANSTYATINSITGNSNLKFGSNTITVTVEAEDGSDKSYIINVTREKYTNANLSDIKIDGVPIENFDPEVTEYNLNNYTKDSVVIGATPEDTSYGSVSGTGTKQLNIGDNEIVIRAYAHNTSVYKDYTININRLSNITTLGMLRVTSTPNGTLSPGFQTAYKGEYTYSYPATTTTVNVEATVSDSNKAYISIHAGNALVGENQTINTASQSFNVPSTTKATIIVTAEDGTIASHVVNFTRQLSSDANLKSLSLSHGELTPEFSSGTVLYSTIVEPEVDYVEVNTETNSIYGEVTSITGNNNLSFGANTITINVVAEDGSDKSYIINLTRKKYINPNLSDIKIDGVSIESFSSTDYEYDITVPYNSNSILLSATPDDETYGSVSGTGTINLSTGANEVYVTGIAHNTEVTKQYKLNINRELNSDTGITGISVAGNSATLNVETNKYEVTIPNSVSKADSNNVTVSVNSPRVSTDAKATYEVPTISLTTLVPNNMVIRVTSENGSTKDYTLIITRRKSNIATLSDIAVTNGSFSPSVSENQLIYTVLVPTNTTSFNVTATKTDPNASLGGVGEYQLVNGKQTVELTVISEDESVTKKYTLNVERIKSSDNKLKGITINNGDDIYTLNPEFDADTTSYQTSVPGIVTSVNVLAETNDEHAKIISGNGSHDLITGDNPITIRVKSESGANLDYTINIVRLPKTNSYLSDIKIDGTSIEDFVKETKSYDLGTVPYSKDSITISASTDDTDATITSTLGEKNLNTGENEFKIMVKAQDESTAEYILTINRTKNNDSSLKVLSVNGSLINPSFNKNITSYTMIVPNTKTTLTSSDITALTTDGNASVEKDASVSLSTTSTSTYNVVVTAENGIDTTTYQIVVSRQKSADNTLKNIELTNASLEPSFNPSTLEYTISVPYGEQNFSIRGIKNNEQATVIGDGNFSKDVGTVTISVTSEMGVVKDYVFNVIEAPSNDASLSSLSVNGYPLTPSFVSTKTVYNIGNIPYTTNTLTVNAEATNINATIQYYINNTENTNNVISIPSTVGNGTITVKVTAADGNTVRSYNISYTKSYSDNAYLKSILPSIGALSFSKTKYLYTLNVAENVNSVSFSVETDDVNAEVSSLNNTSVNTLNFTANNLETGSNQIDILVTAQDGTTTKTYTVDVEKAAPVLSSNANLSSLSVVGYNISPTFNYETLEYDIGQIPYKTETLTINATTSHSAASISYIVGYTDQSGNVVSTPIKNGQEVITLVVEAEDGTTKNYIIRYSKTASTNAYLKNIVVSSGTLNFDKYTTQYIVELGDDVASINLMATLDDNKSTMSINGILCSSPYTLPISPVFNNNTTNIIVTAENGTVLSYKVVLRQSTTSKEITSSEYGHTIENDMIKTARINHTVLDIKNQLDNDNSLLEVWNSNETERLSDTTLLATGQIVKLIINSIEEDRKTIVVKGDVDGSGAIDLFDAVKILNHYLQRSLLSGAYLQAGDTNKDGTIDLFDAVLILNHFLERSSLFD